MNKYNYNFFIFDLGATSGRTMLGTLSNNKIHLKEITRFPNVLLHIQDRYFWDIYALYNELLNGLKIISSENIQLDSIGIDTWGVDFVCLGADNILLDQPRSYRDPYTTEILPEFYDIVSKENLYKLTGIQVLNFNTIFQLFATNKEDPTKLSDSDSILFIPDTLIYMLTDKKISEYTITSTSQLLNPYTKKINHQLLESVSLSPSVFQSIIMPGEVVGCVTDQIKEECKIGNVPVIAVAGHDTASAVVAIPTTNSNFAYLSSGTWSLMGIEVKEPIINEQSYALNFTNEGGVDGTIRFLKNITGMWLLEQCRKEWTLDGRSYQYPDIVEMSNTVQPFRFLIDPDHPSFACPKSMIGAIIAYCTETHQPVPISDAEFIRCIFDSLAFKYRYVLDLLRSLSPFPIETLYIIGGGSKNDLLNQMTANSTGIPVVAGPCEATAIGNMMIQAKGLGLVKDIHEIRTIIRNSVETKTFTPSDTDLWDNAYQKFLEYIK